MMQWPSEWGDQKPCFTIRALDKIKQLWLRIIYAAPKRLE